MIFGDAKRPLFGVYNPPSSPDARTAVVICPPWEREHLRTYKAMLALVDELTRNGCHTLRFDYAGSGNSPGTVDAMSMNGWTQDVISAADEVCAISNCQRLILCGLRLGALVAAQAVVNVQESTSCQVELCLWEPIVSGQSYINHLFETNRTEWESKNRYRPKKYRTDPIGKNSLLGYRINEQWISELAALDYSQSAQATRCIVATQHEAPPSQPKNITDQATYLHLSGNPRTWDDLHIARSHFLPSPTAITELGVGLLYAEKSSTNSASEPAS